MLSVQNLEVVYQDVILVLRGVSFEIPKGKIVDSNFTIADPTSSTTTLNPVGGVTYYENESNLNEDKRNITVLRPSYLELFVSDMRRIMTYSRSSQYVTNKVVQTENTRNTDPN